MAAQKSTVSANGPMPELRTPRHMHASAFRQCLVRCMLQPETHEPRLQAIDVSAARRVVQRIVAPGQGIGIPAEVILDALPPWR